MRISPSKCSTHFLTFSADFRTFSADFRTFPADFRTFPADFRAFPVSAFWLRKLQTCRSGKEAVTRCPAANGQMTWMMGHTNCNLCLGTFRNSTNAHSLLKTISVKFSKKVFMHHFFGHERNFSLHSRVQVCCRYEPKRSLFCGTDRTEAVGSRFHNFGP